MIGRANIEGSKSNIAMNAWLPQVSYPCGNFSDTSSFEFRRSKGSLGHAFTVRIRTGNQNQTSFYPSIPHEISVLVELILGHLHYLLTDVPPHPNSPPDNVFRLDQPAKQALGPKRGASFHKVGLESSSTGSSFPANSAKPVPLAVVSLDSRQGQRFGRKIAQNRTPAKTTFRTTDRPLPEVNHHTTILVTQPAYSLNNFPPLILKNHNPKSNNFSEIKSHQQATVEKVIGQPAEDARHPSINTSQMDNSKLYNNSTKNSRDTVFRNTINVGSVAEILMKQITYLHGEPTIRYDIKEVELMVAHEELDFAVVGKFSYGLPDFQGLSNSIPTQCELKGQVQVGLLCNRHILIRCSMLEDYVALLSKPVWQIKEKNQYHPMRTFKWETWFKPDEETSIAMSWISFSGLPPNYFGESTLFSLASKVGKPITIDAATRNKTRPSCAKVKVEVDLLKEHPKRIQIHVAKGKEIQSKWFSIRYDHLPNYCKTCKLQGHDEIGCWLLNPNLKPERGEENGRSSGVEAGKSIPNPIPIKVHQGGKVVSNREEWHTIQNTKTNKRSDSEDEDDDEDEEEYFDSDPEDQSGDNESDVEMEDDMDESYEEEMERLLRQWDASTYFVNDGKPSLVTIEEALLKK
ncbi:hypothetical protein RND71_009137 [Anisodus tanguticus]|uniref:DUF4283 domain-containing protein n=1 Tax=Anisodus tanguticus TaxID=243964 RepID=A0AAE1SM38_9SOLA|nr:hypothetical protein RND71_009137 [Anisodus tanguticus]